MSKTLVDWRGVDFAFQDFVFGTRLSSFLTRHIFFAFCDGFMLGFPYDSDINEEQENGS
ncbi:MAG: hypothetical protein HFG52_16085 [Lachnospiraceae bacterium]|nr:hypothetical protein [Lachnospiraceae bacterium]